jgi:hypothetical protein
MGCSCGGGGNNVTRYEVRDSSGKKVGPDYPTRGEAAAKQAEIGAGATIRPVVKAGK